MEACLLPPGSSCFDEMQHGGILLILAAAIGAFPVIVVFLIAPGGWMVRICGALVALAGFVLMGFLTWRQDLPPSEPLAAAMVLVSMFTGWRFAKFLDRKLLPVDVRKSK